MTGLSSSGATVAFQGERGAYSEEAVIQRFGSGVEVLPCRTLADVFRAVEKGAAGFGLIPIENSLGGSINESYDLLLGHSLTITGETVLRVRHCLLGLPGQHLDDPDGATLDVRPGDYHFAGGRPAGRVRRVFSHPQALAQCRDFIEKHGLEPVATYDTAGSAKLLAETRPPETAAIAGRRAAEIYGLEILASGIESDVENYTRFYVIEKPVEPGAANRPGAVPSGGNSGLARFDSDSARDGADPTSAKTILVFTTAHRPGSLYWCLGVFAYRSIDLLKLESRPIRGRPWEYLFYADIRGHASDPNLEEALRELATKTTMLRVLGSFEGGANLRF